MVSQSTGQNIFFLDISSFFFFSFCFLHFAKSRALGAVNIRLLLLLCDELTIERN